MARARSRRRPSWQQIRIHRQYTIDEAAREISKCRATLRRWLTTGLPALTEKRPVLILGQDLAEFMRARRKRVRCALDQCYCFKCRVPRKAALAEYIPKTAAGGNLIAICEACGRIMNKRMGLAALPALQRLIDVTIRQADPNLTERSDACLNVNSSKD
jgi:hypothetical protein